jgi:hypothetical protein
MAEPARSLERRLDPDEAIQLDPSAVQQAYRLHRARRRAHRQREREISRARLRFWFVLLAMVASSIALAVVVWRQVEQLFGL